MNKRCIDWTKTSAGVEGDNKKLSLKVGRIMKPEKSSLLQEEKSFFKKKKKNKWIIGKGGMQKVQSEAALSKPNHSNISVSARENNFS